MTVMLLKYLLRKRVILVKASVMAMSMTSAVSSGLRFERLVFLLDVYTKTKEHFFQYWIVLQSQKAIP
jgi:hypothetical protein